MAKKTPNQAPESVQIIAGKWRSRLLKFTATEGLRPTGSRIRETLFNWLAPSIEGARCLDLFAGSGALCFEALSRGAKHCVALENNRSAISHLNSNKALLDVADLRIVATDTLTFLEKNTERSQFDVVFLDPPFEKKLHSNVVQLLTEGMWLAKNALIYCELPLAEPQPMPPNWQLLKDKTAGNVRFCLFAYVEQSDLIK
ncbi:16S rRNA (guanine(966)-N(2))-methyltransferase RsmD [Porticoccaceae bacterium]|nr:16S rRNA (guanine(966)-N(2))-methyltransferase RsmD [Porticoccaceae bacterium]MDA9569539.1 16S rRNA (guanine(966)-N(2))-methyltransferase RsmD [Porticoccaceae bacterium]